MSVDSAPGRARRIWRMLTGQRAGLVAILFLSLWGFYAFAWRGARFFEVPSGSMIPTFEPGDHIVTVREDHYARGDIVVVADDEGYLVKRVVGVAGDTLAVVDGALFINESYASEPYIREPMAYLMEPVAVPEDTVFLLGDNRNESDDDHLTRRSQPLDTVIGRVIFRYYPYDRAGRIRSYPLRNARGE